MVVDLNKEDYSLNVREFIQKVNDSKASLAVVCNPNNPTGNNLDRHEIEMILMKFHGLVVIDEAYSDFSHEKPFRLENLNFEDLISYFMYYKDI